MASWCAPSPGDARIIGRSSRRLPQTTRRSTSRRADAGCIAFHDALYRRSRRDRRARRQLAARSPRSATPFPICASGSMRAFARRRMTRDWLLRCARMSIRSWQRKSRRAPTRSTRCATSRASILSLDFRGDDFLGDPALLQTRQLWPQRVIVMTLARVGAGRRPGLRSPARDHVARGRARASMRAGGVRGAMISRALPRCRRRGRARRVGAA